MTWSEFYRVKYRHVSGPRPSRTPLGFGPFRTGVWAAVRRPGLACVVNPSLEPDGWSGVLIIRPGTVDQVRARLPQELTGTIDPLMAASNPSFDDRRAAWKMGVSDALQAGVTVSNEEPTVLALEGVTHEKSDAFDGNRIVDGQCPQLVETADRKGETRTSGWGNAASEGNPQGLTDNQAAEASTSTAATTTPDVDPSASEPGDSTDPGAPTADPAITGTIELEDRSIVVTVLVILAALAFAWWWRENVTT